jgi:type II secretion system protein C
MLQILAIRQAFVVIEWLLALLLICGATFVCMNSVLHHGPDSEQFMEAATNAADGPPPILSEAKTRQEYDSIITAKLFGPAGQMASQAAPAPEPSAPVEPTNLSLKLCGTAATSPKDIYASAIILNDTNSTIQSYGIGDQVVDQVVLEEIHQKKVILFNKNENRREVLCSDDYEGETAAASQPAEGGKSSSSEKVTLKKAEVIQELMTNYADIVTQIKPELYRDANNNVAGITASNLSSVPLAGKLGVKDGDVLQSVNNEAIDSEDKVVELINKYRNANMIRVGILRGGRPVSLTIKLE